MPARKSGGAAGRRLFAAIRAFATDLPNEGALVIQPGQVVEEGDPVLKGRQHLFEPYEPKIRNYPGRVEQATAAPGEKRS